MALAVTEQMVAVRVGTLALGLLALSAGSAVAAPPGDGWRIRLEAVRPGLVDKGRLTLGASVAAADGFDAFEDPHPPAFPSRFLDLYTRHAQADPEWETQPRATMRYRAEYGSPLGGSDRTLDFFLETDQAGSVALSWGIGVDLDLAQHFLTLRDVEAGVDVDMWAGSVYTFAAEAGARHFQVVLVGGRSAPPIAHDQSVSVEEDGSLPVTLTATDPEGDALTFRIVAAAAHGTLLGVPPSVTYVPDPDYNGADSFQFVAGDGQAESSPGTISVTVTPVNDPPGTVTQQVETSEDTAVAITLLGTDVDGDLLTFMVLSPPAHGSLTGAPPLLTYTPVPEFSGSDSFTFRTHDGQASSGISTVQISVLAVNDPPTAGFTVRGPERRAASWDNNLGSTFEGAQVAGFSSHVLPSFNAANLLDDNVSSAWLTAPGLVTDQFVIVELPGGVARTIDRVRLLNPSSGTQGVRNFEVRVSTTTADPGSFGTVLVERAADNDRLQEFRLPPATRARFVQLLARDNYGATTGISLRSFEVVDGSLPGVPSHLQIPVNAALASEGGSATASSQSVNLPPSRVIDGAPNTAWQSAAGQTTNQQLTVQLGGLYTVDRIRLIGAVSPDTVRNFTVSVSDTFVPGPFVSVFSGTALNNNTVQEFVFPGGPVPARHVRLTIANNYGGASFVSLFELQVIPLQAPVASFSSIRDVTNRPEMLLDNSPSTVWLSAVNRVADEFVKLRLAESALVDRVRIQPSTGLGTDSVKDFEIWVSATTADDAAFVRVLQATALNVAQLQEFVFPGGLVRAAHLKLLVRTSYGGTSVRVATLEVPTVSGEGNILSLPGSAVSALRAESPSLLENGAAVVAYSSADPSRTPAAMLSYQNGLPWTTTGLSGQFAVIQLAGGRVYDLEGVKLTPTTGTDCVRDFELWVSATTLEPGAFVRVLQGTLLRNGLAQPFLFPGGAAARYIRYVPLTNYGNAAGIATEELDVLAPNAGGVVAFSGQFQASVSQRPENAFDGDASTPWLSAGVINQWVKVRLSGGLVRSVPGVSIQPYFNLGPRDFQIRVSTTTADDAAFTTVHTGVLAAVETVQDVLFAAPVNAKYIQFYWATGYQASNYIGVRELKLLGAPDSPSALLLGASSQSTPATNALDIDPQNQPWRTAPAQNTNQWMKIQLPHGESWTVDQVLLKPSDTLGDQSVMKDFEVQVSDTTADDSAFTKALGGTLRNDGSWQHFFFPPVQARYVRLLAKNNYGGTQLALQVFWVVSPQVGGTDARFLDRSQDRDSGGATYAWDFGDGSSSTARDPQHTFPAAGVYDVRLRVTDDGGLTDDHVIRYHAFAPPQADFVWTPLVPNENQAALFTDLSQEPVGGTVYREWDFGDGTARVLNLPTPSHTFQNDGAYPVTLRVASETGLFGSVTKTVTVVNLPPDANAGGDLTIVWGKNWNVGSQATDPSPVDTQTLQCRWQFGDGTPDASGNCNSIVRVAHSYANPGIYTATLTVTDSAGASDSDTVQVTVNKRRTSLLSCGPFLGVRAVQSEVEVTAKLTDLDEPTRILAGYPVVLTVGTESATVMTDGYGVARLRVVLAAGPAVPVTAAFAEEAFYLSSSHGSTTRVGQVVRPMRPDTEGTEFWLAFQTNFSAAPELTFFVTGSTNTTGRVSIPAVGFCGSFSVTAGAVTTVIVPTDATQAGADNIEGKGIQVTALEEVTVYGLNRITFTTDAYLGLPRDILGTEHVVMAYGNSPGSGSQLAVVGAEVGTTAVTITPTGASPGHPVGQPYTVSLRQGESYQLTTPGNAPDLTGSLVSSDKPVAVFGGNRCVQVPAGFGACDHLTEQIPPTVTWGQHFLSMPLATRLRGDTFRFLASENGTGVVVNGVTVATLNRGQFHERVLTVASEITANHPILVAQYSNGSQFDGVTSDPFMMLLPPVEQFLGAYTVSTPATGFPGNYINVVVPTQGLATVRLDGQVVPAASFVPIGTSGYSGAQLTVAAGSHRVVASFPFGATIYGYANFDSYGYPGGMSVAPVSAAVALSLTPEAETSPVNVERCVTARVTDEDEAPVVGVRVDFVVSGANLGNGFQSTDDDGEARFCYTGVQAGQDSIVATMGTLTDTATKTWVANGAPVAADQSVTVDEDTAVAITLAATDADGDPLTYTIVSSPAQGSLSGTPPSVTYTPAADYNGPDSFTFKANDGQVDSNVATVSVTVRPVNDAPVAASQTVATAEDVPVAITLVGTDVDGDALTYVVVAGPVRGTLSGTAPNLTYTPAPDLSGPDLFTFKVNDGQVDSTVATVSVVVTPVNDAPQASNQSVATDEDTAVAFTLAATDADGDTLTYTVVAGPTQGTLSGTAPALTYTPAANYNGPDSFTFRANDGQLDSNVATVSLAVVPVNDSPTASGQTVTTAEDTPVGVTLAGADVDGDPLTYEVVAGPARGTLSGAAPDLTYTPAPDSFGPDMFTFKVNDGQVDSTVATVSVIVTPVNDAPVAANQSIATNEDTAVAVTLAATDVDGDPLTFAVLTAPANGTLSGTTPNLTYTPAANYNGPDGFTFKANDGQVDSNVAAVSLTVAPVNDAPVAASQSVATNEDTAVAVTLAATDVDGDPLTFAVLTAPANGTLGGTAPNLTYTPAANFNGPDSFTFRANDGQVASNVATVSLTVASVNDAPVAASQSVTTNAGTAVAVTLTATDPEGDPLTYSVVTAPLNGTLSGAAPNLTYTPAAGFNGSDSFTFRANDGQASSNLATISIIVTGGNTPPNCGGAYPDVAKLWPPNHSWRTIKVKGVTDAQGGTISIQATSIRQDEPTDGCGDGDTSPDGKLSPLKVRAERSGTGNGRVYHIKFRAKDSQGASCTGEVTVCVPHSVHGSCADGGPLYDSTTRSSGH